MNICSEIHNIFHSAKRYTFPFNEDQIPLNGIYILFEKGEQGHQGDRIVRIGSHTGKNQLCSRLKQHFLLKNKDRSIFRKNIGRAILNKNNDPFLKQWEYDLTSRKNKDLLSNQVDFTKQKEIERQVSDYIQNNFSFVVFEVEEKDVRLKLEKKLISTTSLCAECRSSDNWMGRFSPKKKIRESGLWLVNHLYQTPLDFDDLKYLQQCLKQKLSNSNNLLVDKLKNTFLRKSVFDLTISGAFSRNSIYAEKIGDKTKNEFKEEIWKLLNELGQKYKHQVSVEDYIRDVSYLSKKLSKKYRHVLKDSRLRLGASQKLLSLHLKHLWALGLIEEPPLCPFDGIIIQQLGLNHKWTKLDSVKEFRELIAAVFKRCKEDGFGNNVSLWEMDIYEQGR